MDGWEVSPLDRTQRLGRRSGSESEREQRLDWDGHISSRLLCLRLPTTSACLECNTGDPTCDTPYCKRPVFNFKSKRAGVHPAPTCYRCSQLDSQGNCDIFGIQCAHGDGTPCGIMVEDLDYNNPC